MRSRLVDMSLEIRTKWHLALQKRDVRGHTACQEQASASHTGSTILCPAAAATCQARCDFAVTVVARVYESYTLCMKVTICHAAV